MHLFRSAVVLCWCHPRARDHPRVDLSCCCAVPALCLTCILNAGGIDKRRGPAAVIFAVGGHAGTQSRAVSTLHAGGGCYSVAQGFRCVQGCVDGMRFAGMYDVISSAICR